MPGSIFAEAEELSHDFEEINRRVKDSFATETPDPVAWLAGSQLYERTGDAELAISWRFIFERAQCQKEKGSLDAHSLAYALLDEHAKVISSAICRAGYAAHVRRMEEIGEL